MILSTLICTTVDREEMFQKLYAHLACQCINQEAEILFERDNKEISVGSKRQKLLERAKGDYVSFVDSDDWVPDDYIFNILFNVTRDHSVDCVGFLIDCDIEGRKENAIASNRYEDWGDNIDGYRHVRTIYHKTPVKREHALAIGYKDMRYGEDYEYSKRLKESGLLKKEAFINKVMYYYQYRSTPHAERYGIK